VKPWIYKVLIFYKGRKEKKTRAGKEEVRGSIKERGAYMRAGCFQLYYSSGKVCGFETCYNGSREIKGTAQRDGGG
jgi:hypothetical protein